MSQLTGLEDAEILGDFDFSDNKKRLEIAGKIADRMPRTVFIIPINEGYQARCSISTVQISPQFAFQREIESKKLNLEVGLYASAFAISNAGLKEVVWQRRERNYQVYLVPA